MSRILMKRGMEERIQRSYKIKRRVIIGISVVVLALLYAFKNSSLIIRSMSTIGLLVVFYLIDHLFYLRFETRHYFFVSLIAIMGFMLSPLYFIYPSYDKILHLLIPIMFASVVLHMLEKLKLDKKWQLVFVFFVVVGAVGLHEVGEYILDYFFDWKLQGVFLRDIQGLQKYDILLDRIDDTMIDMMLGILGAGIYVVGVYFGNRFRRIDLGKKKLKAFRN